LFLACLAECGALECARTLAFSLITPNEVVSMVQLPSPPFLDLIRLLKFLFPSWNLEPLFEYEGMDLAE